MKTQIYLLKVICTVTNHFNECLIERLTDIAVIKT